MTERSEREREYDGYGESYGELDYPHHCAACGAPVTPDEHGTLVDETGGDVCTERGDDTPHILCENEGAQAA